MNRADIIDTHAHLDDKKFAKDRENVLKRASDAGVTRIITVGNDFTASRYACALAEQYPEIYAAVGIHPHEAKEVVPRTLEGLRILAENSKVLAWGEIGLDYHYDFSPRDCQQDVFRKQLEIAGELGLPVIIHDREAHEDVLSILKDFTGLKAVAVHCFSGDMAIAEECLNRGYYLGIGGTLTFPKNNKLQQHSKLPWISDSSVLRNANGYSSPLVLTTDHSCYRTDALISNRALNNNCAKILWRNLTARF